MTKQNLNNILSKVVPLFDEVDNLTNEVVNQGTGIRKLATTQAKLITLCKKHNIKVENKKLATILKRATAVLKDNGIDGFRLYIVNE